MTHSQFAMLIGNIYVAVSFLTEKYGPMFLASLWIFFSWYIIWNERKQ